MPRFFLTLEAQADFDGIGSYTANRWGLRQAEKYLTDLDDTFHQLAKESGLGRDRHDLRPELLAYPCNKHMLFFRRDAVGNVQVLRILHQSMDFERHL